MSEPEPGMRVRLNSDLHFIYDMTVVRAEWTIPTRNVPLFVQRLHEFDTEAQGPADE